MHLKITSGVALTATREVTLGPTRLQSFDCRKCYNRRAILTTSTSGSTVMQAVSWWRCNIHRRSGAGAGVKDSLANINITVHM